MDFLGFSRPNLDLSMGYGGFSLKKFFVALLPLGAFGRRDRRPQARLCGAQKGS